MSKLLSATGLGLLRGERRLFHDVSVALDAGEALLVQGANGSGKTSLLRVLAGLLEPDAGEVSWRGRATRDARQEFCAELAWYGHRGGCKQDLTLLENLACERALRPASPTPLAEILARLELAALTDLPLRVLSAGQQRRVALARLLVSSATLWLLDEPYTNLDRGGQALIDELVAGHLAGGGVCVMASHHVSGTTNAQRTLTLS